MSDKKTDNSQADVNLKVTKSRIVLKCTDVDNILYCFIGEFDDIDKYQTKLLH